MDAHDYRLTREVDIAGNERGRLSLAIEKLTTIVERQEDRTDKLELRFAQVFAIIALLVFVANIVGPFVVNWLTSGRLP